MYKGFYVFLFLNNVILCLVFWNNNIEAVLIIDTEDKLAIITIIRGISQPLYVALNKYELTT